MRKVGIVLGVLCVLGAAGLIGPRLSSGGTAPDFTLYAGGSSRTVSLSELRGKVVVLDFWASWCGPCRMAIPELEAINQQYSGKGVVVLGINVRDEGDPQAALRKFGATYPTLIQGESVASDYGVSGIPTIVVIGRDGGIVYQASGWSSVHGEQIREAIEGEVGESD